MASADARILACRHCGTTETLTPGTVERCATCGSRLGVAVAVVTGDRAGVSVSVRDSLAGVEEVRDAPAGVDQAPDPVEPGEPVGRR